MWHAHDLRCQGGAAGDSVCGPDAAAGQERNGPDAPCTANNELSVGEVMVTTESRMREIRTSDSMSGDWKRNNGVEQGTGTAEAAGKRLPPLT